MDVEPEEEEELSQFPETRFDPWVRKIHWRRDRLPTLVFWPGEFHGLYSPRGHKESDTTKRLSLSFPKPHGYSSHHCGHPGSCRIPRKGSISHGHTASHPAREHLKGDGSAHGHVSPRLGQSLLPQRAWGSVLHGSLQWQVETSYLTSQHFSSSASAYRMFSQSQQYSRQVFTYF